MSLRVTCDDPFTMLQKDFTSLTGCILRFPKLLNHVPNSISRWVMNKLKSPHICYCQPLILTAGGLGPDLETKDTWCL